jgi:hypothetical protein
MAIIFFLWLVLCVVIGAAAAGRGRSGFGYFVLSFLLSPLIGGLVLLLLPNKAEIARHAELVAAIRREPVPPTQADAIATMMGADTPTTPAPPLKWWQSPAPRPWEH